MIRIIGAALLVIGFSLIGYVRSKKKKTSLLDVVELIRAMDLMICELEYRKTSLPELCTFVANNTTGCISKFFREFGDVLSKNVALSVRDAGAIALESIEDITMHAKEYVITLVDSLGAFDVSGQIAEINAVKEESKVALKRKEEKFLLTDKTDRILWVSLGLVIAIIFI